MRARLRLMSVDDEAAAAAVGELELDEDRYEVRVGGMQVDLTFKEFELLRFLMSRPGQGLHAGDYSSEQVWGYDYFGAPAPSTCTSAASAPRSSAKATPISAPSAA